MQIVIIFFIAFVLFVIWKYWTLFIGAGYDPTPIERVHKMLWLARLNENDVLYDLGSGDGRILLAAAKKYGVKAVGIEADPFRFVLSWFFVLLAGQTKRIRVKFGNFFKEKIGDASVVTVFLYTPTNNRLKEKFFKELKPGTRIVSYFWIFHEWEPRDSLPNDNIYLYVI